MNDDSKIKLLLKQELNNDTLIDELIWCARELYKDRKFYQKIRSIIFNIRTNPTFKSLINSGKYDSIEIVTIKPEEVNPEMWQEILHKNKLKMEALELNKKWLSYIT